MLGVKGVAVLNVLCCSVACSYHQYVKKAVSSYHCFTVLIFNNYHHSGASDFIKLHVSVYNMVMSLLLIVREDTCLKS